MTQRTQVVLTDDDDIDGSEAEETVRIGLHGSDCEIDLSKKHADQLAEAIEPHIRVVRVGQRVAGAHRPSVRSAGHRRHQAAVREWACAHGLDVTGRGRIPTDVVANY